MIALTIYTDKLPEGVGGAANAFIVRIRPKYKDDKGIHRHEYEHVKQWWIASLIISAVIAIASYTWQFPVHFALFGFASHPMAYMFIDKYRLHAEAAAFAKQVKPDHSDLEAMADRLASDHYGLHITKTQAVKEISKHL